MPDEKQPELPGVIRNEARYRDLSKPFESAGAFSAAVDAFYQELGELRVKYKIPDVYLIIEARALNAEGEEGQYFTALHYGDSSKMENMTAWAFGQEQATRQALTARILASASVLKKGRREK
jgi:hypothetical protein